MIEDFRMPRYREIPDVGLYLEQVTRYINGFLAPIGGDGITASMVSNYVKQGYIPNPIKKQYYAEHIARLLFLCVVKRSLSIENAGKLLELQQQVCDTPRAYDLYCQELEDSVKGSFGLCPPLAELGEDVIEERHLLRSIVLATANVIYLNERLRQFGEKRKEMKKEETKKGKGSL